MLFGTVPFSDFLFYQRLFKITSYKTDYFWQDFWNDVNYEICFMLHCWFSHLHLRIAENNAEKYFRLMSST